MWAHKALRLHKNGICSFMRRRRSKWKKKGTFFSGREDNLKKGKFLFACLPKMDYFLLCVVRANSLGNNRSKIFALSSSFRWKFHAVIIICMLIVYDMVPLRNKKKVKIYYLFRSRSPTSHVMINWGETRDNMCKIISKLNFMWTSELLWCYFEGDMWLPYARMWVWNF